MRVAHPFVSAQANCGQGVPAPNEAYSVTSPYSCMASSLPTCTCMSGEVTDQAHCLDQTPVCGMQHPRTSTSRSLSLSRLVACCGDVIDSCSELWCRGRGHPACEGYRMHATRFMWHLLSRVVATADDIGRIVPYMVTPYPTLSLTLPRARSGTTHSHSLRCALPCGSDMVAAVEFWTTPTV